MEIIVLTILTLGGVFASGAIIVVLIGLLPLPLLERAQRHGRFAGLGTPETVARPGKLSFDLTTERCDGRMHPA
jgi:hypothetical protein